MKTFEEYLLEAERAHGHMCAGQILGVRLALLGLKRLGIADPVKERKRLVTFVEIDRCATDAIALVTGCRLGKRALKFRDWGKVAATFIDLASNRAIRVVARENSRELAAERFAELANPKQQQMAAYRELPDADLFDEMWVEVELAAEELPGYKGPRATCAECGEGINFNKGVVRADRTLCRGCAGESYYTPVARS
jgi:formylmethanofuran dehydrogenase subunit E